MDSLRSNFSDGFGLGEPDYGYDSAENEILREAPPSPVGQDERRMQVRAYNYWASLLGDRVYPSIEDLEPENLADFGPYSVLLDFTAGIEDPGIAFLGGRLAEECGADDEITHLSDVPNRSLLSRITDHYMQILANQAPIGFEAEFINAAGRTILYRGILLPFSSDDDTIDFIYGVINWKELADQQTTDALLRELDAATAEPFQPRPDVASLADWADAPLSSDDADEDGEEYGDGEYGDDDGVLDLGALIRSGFSAARNRDLPVLPAVEFAQYDEDPFAANEMIAAHDEIHVLDDSAEMALGDWLASAREMARMAHSSEDRTRHALYGAIGRAYDFSLAAAQAPGDFAELLSDAGLTMQDRAPMTPVVKLVFGADYDKTRLTEYAAALSHGHRLGVEPGAFAGFLASAEGGLKGVVNAERRLRREETAPAEKPEPTVRESVASALRAIDPVELDDLPADGAEFALVMVRRMADGRIVVLGEVPQDVSMIEKAARKLVS